MAKTADLLCRKSPSSAGRRCRGCCWCGLERLLGCAPWKGGTFPVGERPTRRTRSRRKQPEQSWNTKYLEVAYTELRRQGRTINDDLLRHVAPLGWEHIGLTGDYVWSTVDQP